MTPYETLFKEENLHFHYGSERHFPLSVQGPLKSGHFVVPGDVSSQFISGLLFALPLLQRDSTIEITGSFESQSYVALTLSALSTFGVHVFQDEPRLYRVLGGQAYRPYSGSVEGDFSQAAFFLVAGALGKEYRFEASRQVPFREIRQFFRFYSVWGLNLKKARKA